MSSIRWGILVLLLALLVPRPSSAQSLDELDYDNLRFRGMMLDVGYIFPSRVEPTATFGGRVDLGFLGPGVRAVFGFNHWSSFLKEAEVGRLEARVGELIEEQSGEPVSVDLGEISWSDTSLHGDVHLMWAVPYGLLTYAGLGASAHILRGGGEAVNGTFVEDFLDSVRAGMNVHGGLEVPIHRRFRLVGEARYEILENLNYAQLRLGGQFTFGDLADGEE